MKSKSKTMKDPQALMPSYIDAVPQGSYHTMEDCGTKLYIRAVHDLTVIKVDDGIIKGSGSKKCDFLCEVRSEKCVHLFELKKGKIDDAFLQLEITPQAIQEHSVYKTLLDGLNRLDAYIVSPSRLRVPNNLDERQRRLCKKLAGYCRQPIDNIMHLLKLVAVDSSCKKLEEVNGRIRCSHRYPLEL